MRFYVFVVFCVIFCTSVKYAESGKILAIVPTPSYSHQKAFRALWTELATRGHEIVLLTTHPINNSSLTNLQEIDLSFAIKYVDEDYGMDKHLIENQGVLQFLKHAILVRIKTNEQILLKSQVQDLIHNKSKYNFDLIIHEHTVPNFMGFAHIYNVPIIQIYSMADDIFLQEIIGGVNHPVAYPMHLGVPDYDDFLSRLTNFIIFNGVSFALKWIMPPMIEDSLKHIFGEDCPGLFELAENIHMVFMYRDYAFHQIRPTAPAQVNIGPLHIEEPKPLTKDVQEYMDNSKNGVIYFSLGSSVKCKDITNDTFHAIIETFKELPYDILWKYELEDLKEKPSNVKIVKWAQQQDILRHPNLKLFITQGGLQSIEEALYTYNPMLVLHVAGDQMFNGRLVALRGFGLELKLKTLNKESFKSAILEIINNHIYKENVKKSADLALDQPMTSLERAVWWTEYVIRNKGAAHLKGAGINMPLYQYLLLDVIAFCLFILLILYFLLKLLFKAIKRIFKLRIKNEKMD